MVFRIFKVWIQPNFLVLTLVLTNAFVKKTNKTPPGELGQALLSKVAKGLGKELYLELR